MKPSWRAADRATELLSAARGWREAALIDEAAFGAITAGHASAGPRLGPLWRTLVFLCVAIGIVTATAIGFVSFGVREPDSAGRLLLVIGVVLAVATDVLLDLCSFRPTGAEAATAVLAAGYLCAGMYALLDVPGFRGPVMLRVIHPWCAAVFALAAWRWGFRLFGAASALFMLLFAAQLPGARICWAIAAGLIAALATTALATRDLVPSHRGALTLARVVGLAALYVAVSYLSVEQGWIEEIGRAVGERRHRAGSVALAVAALGSALYPAAILARGVRSRDRVLMDVGLASAALSLATIRFYVPFAPLWLVLAVAGAGLAGGSLALERWLRSGRDGERSGFTAAPLYDEERSERLLPLAAALAAAPGARTLAEDKPGLGGAGGSFGGGGAAGTF